MPFHFRHFYATPDICYIFGALIAGCAYSIITLNARAFLYATDDAALIDFMPRSAPHQQ